MKRRLRKDREDVLIVLTPVLRIKSSASLSLSLQKRLRALCFCPPQDDRPHLLLGQRPKVIESEYERAWERQNGAAMPRCRGPSPNDIGKRLGVSTE